MTLMQWFNHQTAQRYQAQEDIIINVCRSLGLSEFEFFCIAGKNWGIELGRVQEDYRKYLFLNDVPTYVMDWISVYGEEGHYA